MSQQTDDGPNTRPSSPRSNASTPRGGPDHVDPLVDLSAIRSLPGTPRPSTPGPGGNRKSKHRKCKPCKKLRRRTKRIIRKRRNYH